VANKLLYPVTVEIGSVNAWSRGDFFNSDLGVCMNTDMMATIITTYYIILLQ